MTDSIVKKVRALLLKAEGTIGAESEAFMAKVRELMAKHQLEMHTLRQEPDPLGQHNQGLLLEEQWEVAVCEAGAEYFGCAAVFMNFTDDITMGCTLYGRQSACATSMEMLAYWIREVKRVAGLIDLPAQAVGDAFAVRLAALIKEHGPAPSNGTDLVPVDEAKAAARAGGETEERSLILNTFAESRAAAAGISLELQMAGGRKHKEIV